jgi:tetratricopeptide (TPR) repeat protein
VVEAETAQTESADQVNNPLSEDELTSVLPESPTDEPIVSSQCEALIDRIDRPEASQSADERPTEPTPSLTRDHPDRFVTDTNTGDWHTWAGFSTSMSGHSRNGRSTIATPHESAWYQDSETEAVTNGFRRDQAGPETKLDRAFPSVADILAARPASRTKANPGYARNKTASRPFPTVASEPEQWRMHAWLAAAPMVVVVLVVGGLSVSASWGWAIDSRNAGIVSRRLTLAEPLRLPLPEWVKPGGGSWWATNAGRLVQWSAYLDRQTSDPGTTEEARRLLEEAALAAPLDVSVQYAKAHGLPGDASPPPLSRALAQSRDVQSLTLAGRQLHAAGKTDAALRAFGVALEMAANSGPGQNASVSFLDDPQLRRYTLPTEELISSVVREMDDLSGWTYKDWKVAIPPRTVAALAVARVLRARHRPDAENALDDALVETERALIGFGREGAIQLAVQAETLALKARWTQSEECYRKAIALMPDDSVRRSWWMNVADLSLRVNDEPSRLKALELAKSLDPKDEITQRAVELQKAIGVVTSSSVAKAEAKNKPRQVE